MSQKYLAWNGEEYPWPPPQDWYEASDGRWWAPNSGPGPKTDDVASQTRPSNEAATQISSPQEQSSGFGGGTSNSQPASDFDATSVQPQVDANQNPTPGFQQPQFGGAPTQNPTPGFQQPQFGGAPQAPFGSGPGQNQGPQQPQQFGTGPAPYNTGAQPSSGGSKLPLILAGVVALVAILGIGIFAVTRGGGDTTPDATTTTTPDLSTTTTVDQTTTTVEPTTTTEPVDQAAALEGFRGYVATTNIVGLNDVDLNGIGEEACTAATSSIDLAEWDVQVLNIVNVIKEQQAITPPEVGEPLTDDAIREIYEGAITFYCPANAERLGVSV